MNIETLKKTLICRKSEEFGHAVGWELPTDFILTGFTFLVQSMS